MKPELVLGLLLFLCVLQLGQPCFRGFRCGFWTVHRHFKDGCNPLCPNSTVATEIKGGSYKCSPLINLSTLCKRGYFRMNNGCKRCRNCEKEGKKQLRSCTRTSDTVCLEVCKRGQFLESSKGSCQSCPAGRYMSEERHNNTKCRVCSVPDFSKNEVELRKCTATDDAIIRCKPGYFRQNDKCIPCRQCGRRGEKRYIVRPCSEASDTVCGNECGPGQFLDRSHSACVPCPENTFMAEEKHHNLECQLCTVPVIYSAERVEWKCNKTHDSIIMCSNDHFRTRGGDGCECVRCLNCGHNKMIRPCGERTDRVCEGIKPRRVRKDHLPC